MTTPEIVLSAFSALGGLGGIAAVIASSFNLRHLRRAKALEIQARTKEHLAEAERTEAEADSISVQAATRTVDMLSRRIDEVSKEMIQVRATNRNLEVGLKECARDRAALHEELKTLKWAKTRQDERITELLTQNSRQAEQIEQLTQKINALTDQRTSPSI